jgi:hypothetical protein
VTTNGQLYQMFTWFFVPPLRHTRLILVRGSSINDVTHILTCLPSPVIFIHCDHKIFDLFLLISFEDNPLIIETLTFTHLINWRFVVTPSTNAKSYKALQNRKNRKISFLNSLKLRNYHTQSSILGQFHTPQCPPSRITLVNIKVITISKGFN